MLTRKELKKQLGEDLKRDPPSNIRHFTQKCKKLINKQTGKNYYDLVEEHIDYLDSSARFSEKLYHVIHDLLEQPKCKNCGKKVEFYRLTVGYKEYCSNWCSTQGTVRNQKRKQTNLKRYGVENPMQVEEFKDKCVENITIKHGGMGLGSEHIKKKAKQTCLDNYNVDNPLKSTKVQEKLKQTLSNKSDSEKEATLNKRIQTNLKLFGEKFPLQSDKVKENNKQTWLINLGVENPSQSNKVKEKKKQTNLERRNIENPMLAEDVKEKNSKTQQYAFFEKLIKSDRLKNKCEPLFTFESYRGINSRIDNKFSVNIYPFRCNKCSNEFEAPLSCGRIPRCPICYPLRESTGETEVVEFCRKYYNNIIRHDKNIIKSISNENKQLDIYIPEINLAIEYNGLYYHSEDQNKDQYYHQNKTLCCLQQNIKLIHIFEDEWYEKQFIVESLLLDRFNMNQWEIPAENCNIVKIETNEALDFHYENSLITDIPLDSYSAGLTYNSELVAVLTVGRSRLEIDSMYDLEIYGYNDKIYTRVENGLDKLLKYIPKNSSIVTYIDARYDLGEEFKQAGFNFLNVTKPRVYKELVNNNRVWDCGYVKYELGELCQTETEK